MHYDKPSLDFQGQADLLIERGLEADRTLLLTRLQSVSYYRLSAYLYPYRQVNSDNFRDGTTLDIVWMHYTFDRQLRLLVMDAIERVEIALRAQLACLYANRHGAFGYLNPQTLPNIADRYTEWKYDLLRETNRSKETFLLHFRNKYGDHHDMPPIWMLAEIMSFGRMFTFFNGVDNDLRIQIARSYGIEIFILESWLRSLNTTRNICAHHGRLWNRELGTKPVIPRLNKYPQWHEPVAIPNIRVFATLTILRYLLRYIAPGSAWPTRIKSLLDRYNNVSRDSMGFPNDWESSLLWKA